MPLTPPTKRDRVWDALNGDIDRILLSAEQIECRVREMAAEIAGVYEDSEAGLTLIPVLSGSIIFLADLMRELPLKMKLALVHLSSYRGATTESVGTKTVLNLQSDVRGRHVLIVDDILDTGNTLRHVQRMIGEREPESLRTAVLLRKPEKAPKDVHADFIGFDIEDAFVVGYGLDYGDHYRNLPHIGVLRSELMP